MELGVPFCDPIADGPTIQAASQAALESGARLPDILDAVRPLELPVPVSLMSYLNPLLAFGRERLLDSMAECGIAGLIVPDLPVEEAETWVAATARRGVDLTLLVAPTSTPDRIRRIAELSQGFLYYVSVTGVTGAREALPHDLFDSLRTLRELTDKPVAVGFGLSSAAQIASLRGRADGAVVGSRIVEAIRRGEDLPTLIRELKQATRSTSHVGSDGAQGN